jgi:hypothetical protein
MWFLGFVALSGMSFAQSRYELDVSRFEDAGVIRDQIGLQLTKSNVFKTDGETPTSVSLSFNQGQFKHKELDPVMLQRNRGSRVVRDHSYSLGIDQSLNALTYVGVNYGKQEASIDESSYWYGLSLGRWWLSETFQSVVNLQQSRSEQNSVDLIDYDFSQVRTPKDVEGLNVGLQLTHLTTPTTMIRSQTSHTQRNDRPDAFGQSLEIRQAITSTESAVHLKAAHYENTGTITRQTLYGEIVANSISAEWHQRLFLQWIAMGGYRYYREEERPRVAEASRIRTASDYFFTSLRYRLDQNAWVQENTEVFILGGRYINNQENIATHFGIGISFIP